MVGVREKKFNFYSEYKEVQIQDASICQFRVRWIFKPTHSSEAKIKGAALQRGICRSTGSGGNSLGLT